MKTPPDDKPWFEGVLPKKVVSLGINKILGVKGATAVIHRDSDENVSTRYEIVDKKIVRPDREEDRQFLVTGLGCELEFESESDTVFVVGFSTEGPKGLNSADRFFQAR